MRKVDMAKYSEKKSTLDMIQLQYYRAIGPVTPVKDDAALHAAGHLYASDRNGLFPVSFINIFSNKIVGLMCDRYQISWAKVIHTVPLLL
jgi:hypothetical protein